MTFAYKLHQTTGALTLTIILSLAFLQSHAQQAQRAGSGYVPVNNIKVYYEVYGEGKPIVLLHGAFMTIDTNWGEIIPELSKTRKVIAIELQGHGHSPLSDRKLDFPTLASDVEGVMSYLKVDSAVIVGYSFGGTVAYHLAVQSPKRVTKLVIISSTYKSNGWLPEVNGAFKSMKPEMFDGSPLKTSYESVAPDKTKWPKFAEQMLAFIAVAHNIDDAKIAKIACPVLLISGDNDGIDKVELAKTYRLLGGDKMADFGVTPKSQLAVVPSQGHVSVMMQAKTILGFMEGFFK